MIERQRRPQAERVEETRRALLDATVTSLVEVGYAATTTREVAQRAGVSRGAQTHHFPAKDDLVAASIEYLFTEQVRSFRRAFEAIPPAQRNLRTAIEMLWGIIDGPTYAAVLEVTLAARTDENLRVVVHAMAALLEEGVHSLLVDLFPHLWTDDRTAHMLTDVAFSILQGAAISRYAGFGDPDRTVRLAGSVAGMLTPDVAPIVKGVLDAFDHD